MLDQIVDSRLRGNDVSGGGIDLWQGDQPLDQRPLTQGRSAPAAGSLTSSTPVTSG